MRLLVGLRIILSSFLIYAPATALVAYSIAILAFGPVKAPDPDPPLYVWPCKHWPDSLRQDTSMYPHPECDLYDVSLGGHKTVIVRFSI